MLVNYLINNSEPLVTERKAEQKGLNPSCWNFKAIRKPRFIFGNGSRHWLLIVVDSEDGHICMSEWKSDAEAEELFLEQSDHTIEL